jgi:hypothetical protein
MAEAGSTLTRHDLEAKIVKRCWEDEAFRKEFTADPAVTFVKYLDVPAASLPKIVIHQEPAGSWHIVIPAKPAFANELSEQDLEKVAGGISAVDRYISPGYTPQSALAAAKSGAVSVAAAITAAGAAIVSVAVSVEKTAGW